MSTPDRFQNRIVGEDIVDPATLVPNPQNWRVHPAHQTEAVAAALSRVGWVQRVIVNRTTGHLVDGHLRLSVALERGESEIPVNYVELEEGEEKLVLATLDPLGALAVADVELLEQLRAEADAQGPLSDVLDDLIGAERAGLDELDTDAHGPVANDKDFWPVIRVQVPPETFGLYKKLLDALEIADESEAFTAILNHALDHVTEAAKEAAA